MSGTVGRDCVCLSSGPDEICPTRSSGERGYAWRSRNQGPRFDYDDLDRDSYDDDDDFDDDDRDIEVATRCEHCIGYNQHSSFTKYRRSNASKISEPFGLINGGIHLHVH